jgi:DnaJ-class molecular chaperone
MAGPLKVKIGDRVPCSLCGGDGYVSRETAEMGGRHHGDTTCPSCDGSGRMPYRPLCHTPSCMRLAVCDECTLCFKHCKCKGGPK